MENELENKIIVVTGASRGIGRATADLLRSRGAAVIGTSRKGNFSTPDLTPLDVGVPESVAQFFDWLDRTYDRLDVLVNNAGVAFFKPIVDTSLEEWNSMLQTNLTGAFLCAKEAMRRMKRTGGGRIINIGSVADRVALPHNAAYSASKFGLRILSQILTEEGKVDSIFSTLLSVGAVRTDLWKNAVAFQHRTMLQPLDVAESILHIVRQPPHVRVDEVQLMPPSGLL